MMHAQLAAPDGGRVVFDGVRVDGQLHGMLLDVTLVQTFRNPGAAHIELVYTFPLPADAVLLAMHARLGERRLSGGVVEKKAASARYEDTLADGDTAIMLEQAHDGSYCLNFGNLGPGETGAITLRYAQALRFEGDGLRLCIPTVIAPRYGDPVQDGGLAPHQATTHDLGAHYPFALALRLAPDFAAAAIASPSHAIHHSGDSAGIDVRLHAGAALDRDFVLTLSGLAGASCAIAALAPGAAHRSAVLAGFRPCFADDGARPLRVKILVDCSGSMAGDSIAASRQALQKVVAGFAEGDCFALSRFGDRVEHRTRRLWKTSAVTRLSAARWVGDLEADLGGTEMETALTSTFALDGGAPSDVLLVTDGHIHAIDGVIAAARTAGHRLFIVAIGSAASETQLRRLARATGGAVDLLAPGEAVEPAIARMFARLRSPRLAAPRLAWTGGRAVHWEVLPDALFSGETMHAYALVEGDAAGAELRLYASNAAGIERHIATAVPASAPDDGALARLAVHARLQGDDKLTTVQRTRLACDHGLVTAHTNFLLTHERAAADKARAMPELAHVPQMLAAGWGGAGSVTAASTPWAAPAMFRRAPDSTGHGDLPVFLRKQNDDLRASMLRDRPVQSRWQRMVDWRRQAFAGAADPYLTPLAVHDMLASTPHALWDASFADMAASGFDPAVMAWLRGAFGSAYTEDEIVASFMACMAQPGMGRTLRNVIARCWRLIAKPVHWQRGAPARTLPSCADAKLVARITAALAGISGAAWPPAVRRAALQANVFEPTTGKQAA